METRDEPDLERIREAAFAPIFDSFRSMLGGELYALTQERGDHEQAELLASIIEAGSGWETFVAVLGVDVVGFVSIQLNRKIHVGEIGLNAVDPRHVGRGVGTAMYEHALGHMKEAGMRAATVSTGGDPSHAPARRAYQKAGFEVGIPSVWLCRTL